MLAPSSLRAAAPAELERIRATAPVVAGIFTAHAEAEHLPGLAWGVVTSAGLLYSGAVGQANLAQSRPADARTAFRIASMSKSFTALAILQLRDAGKLALDAPVATWLPEFAGHRQFADDAPAITVRHLLTHAAGFPEDNPWGDRQLDASAAELGELIEHGIALSNAPGIAYEYSNTGFALLGRIVERVSGQPLAEYMSANVFEPLGMTTTTYEFTEVPEARLALGYGWREGEWFVEPLLHHGAFGAMGGLIASVEDFARYAALHLSAWPPRDGARSKVLRRASLREMHQPWNFAGLDADFSFPDGRVCPVTRAYAYGLRWMTDCEGRTFIGHAGGLPGFGSNWTMMPAFDLAVVSLDNRTYGSTTTVNLQVLDAIVAAAELEPRAFPVSPILRARGDALFEVLQDFDRAGASDLFAENFFPDTPLAIRRREVEDALTEVGRVTRRSPVQAINRLRGTFVIEGEDADLEVFFSLSPETDPRIQALRLQPVER